MQVAREWKLWTHRAEILSHGDLTKKRRQEREQAAQAAKNYTGLAAVLEKEGDCAQGQISPRSPLDLPSISPRSSLDLPSIYPRSPLDLPSIYMYPVPLSRVPLSREARAHTHTHDTH